MMAMAATQKQFTGKHMLAIMIAFFSVIVGVNLLMAYFANSTWSGLVVANGYVASQSFDKDLARAKAQDSLGWTVNLSHLDGRIRITFADKDSNLIEGLAITGALERTVTDKQDQTLAFTSMGAGVYTAPATLTPGVWEVEIDAKGNGAIDDYHKIFRFTVDN
jgi:nitrogen fixation protein FixH